MTTWTELRTATRDRLIAAGIAGGNVEASRYAPVVAGGPALVRVYLRSGSYSPVGDLRTGIPDFDRSRRLVISITRAAGAGEELDDDLDSDIDAVLAALLTDAEWVEAFEGVGSIDVDYDAKDDGEFRSIEAVISIEVFDRATYEPVITDAFEAAAVATDLGDGTPVSGAYVEPPQA